MTKIVATCIELMLKTLKKDNLANFGFLGSNTMGWDNKFEESTVETKRFKIYRHVISNYLSQEKYQHYQDIKNSTYLVVNKKHGDCDSIKVKADTMFEHLFPIP